MSTGTTPVVTAVKYEVDEHNLVNWLKEKFGTDAKHELASDESGTGYWKVTAPREITAEEQRKLKKKGLKKRKTLEH